jgi:hypothetical protein
MATKILRPNAPGDYNNFASGSYLDVNDQNDNTYCLGLYGQSQGVFQLPSANLPSGATISSVKYYVRAQANGGNTNFGVRIRKRYNGVETEASEISGQVIGSFVDYSATISTTLAELNSGILQAGCYLAFNNQSSFYLSEVWIEITYTVPTPPAPTLYSPTSGTQTFDSQIKPTWYVPSTNNGLNYHFFIKFTNPEGDISYEFADSQLEWDQGTGSWIQFPSDGVPAGVGKVRFNSAKSDIQYPNFAYPPFYPGTWKWKVRSCYIVDGSFYYSSYSSEWNFVEKVPDIPTIEAPTSGQILTSNPIITRFTNPQATDNKNLHFQLDIARDSGFSDIVASLDTQSSQTDWEYSSNGTDWVAFPSSGVAEGVGKVRYSRNYICDQYWWRIRAKLNMSGKTFYSSYASNNFYRGYASPKQVQSKTINLANNCDTVKLIPTHNLNGQTINYYVSVDGVHFEQVQANTRTKLSYSGNQLIWRAILSTSNPLVTPKLEAIEIDIYPYPADLAIDDNYGTGWKSEGKNNSTDTEELVIGFNGTYGINTVHIVPGVSGLSVTGYYTPDGSNYLQIFQVSNLSEQKIHFDEVQAQGIKLVFTNLSYQGGKYYAEIKEVEAYKTIIQSGKDISYTEDHFYGTSDVKTAYYCNWDNNTKYVSDPIHSTAYLISKTKETISNIFAVKVDVLTDSTSFAVYISIDNGSTYQNVTQAVNTGKYIVLRQDLAVKNKLSFKFNFGAVNKYLDYYKIAIIYKEKII